MSAVLAALLMLVIWLVWHDAPLLRFLVRLYRDKSFLGETVASWGWMAPVVFIAIQALQVIVSPIPGEMTGPVGGALFGVWWAVVYSTIGLTIGTLVCFGVGRRWGEPLVRPWLSEHHWNRMSFILEAEGAILCFIVYLIPGVPKDIVSYLFRHQPHAVLGVRRHLHARPHPRDVDLVLLRRARGRAAVPLRGGLRGLHHRPLPARLLLPRSDHRALPAEKILTVPRPAARLAPTRMGAWRRFGGFYFYFAGVCPGALT